MTSKLNGEQLSGRALGEAVAERVMQWRLIDRCAMGWNPDGPDVWATGDEANPTYQRFNPHESVEAAMRVVEKMAERGYDAEFLGHNGWYAVFKNTHAPTPRTFAKSLPEAICHAALAALKAMEGK